MCHFMLPSRESKLVISLDGRYANEGIKLSAEKMLVLLHEMHWAILGGINIVPLKIAILRAAASWLACVFHFVTMRC